MLYIPEIKAEFLLNMFFPEKNDDWAVYCDGTFYRNYNADVLNVFPEINEIHVSRDSVLSLMPEGMIGGENLLRMGDRQNQWEKLHARLNMLRSFFCPIDTILFRENLKVEREMTRILEDRLNIVLRELFDINLNKIENPLVKNYAKLLPFVEMIRGDYGKLCSLLSTMIQQPVRMDKRHYSIEESNECSIMWLVMMVEKNDMDEDSLQEFFALMQPLEDFLREWFIPFCVKFSIEVEGVSEESYADYNARIK
ncbi:MAG: hypothetical protein HUK08_01495 [Bacteroidaceae bacterium]|nr:hypothetical protein [Bacteroidaceae bacterium]